MLRRLGIGQSESRIIHLNAARQPRRHPKNLVVNTKYTVLSFLPKVLYEQFKYFWNLYFLLVAVSQIFPPLRIGLLVTYVAPLAFVMAVTMTKEAYDDLKRWRTDCEINSELYVRLLPGGGTETIRSHEISVGHMLRLQTTSACRRTCFCSRRRRRRA
jgi:phospholipid-translocating ATPase